MTELFADRYRITKELGRGSFGVVYLAHDTRLNNRPVALKVLHPSLNADPSTVQLFQSEAAILAGLEHDHIVPIYDVGLDQGTRFLVMKLVAGRSLAEILAVEGRQPPERVLHWLEDIAAGMDYAHSKGVLHRDLKPGNLLLDEARERVVITDFGLARAVQQSGGSGVSQSQQNLTGTAYYMAPEVIKGGKQTSASDLYSLGCVLFEALQGERPFQGENLVAISFQHVQAPVPPLNLTGDLGELLAAQVTALLAKDPAARPPSATGAVQAVRQGLRDREEAARAAAAAAALVMTSQSSPAPSGTSSVAVPPGPPLPPDDIQPSPGPTDDSRSVPWRPAVGVTLLALAVIFLVLRGRGVLPFLPGTTATSEPTTVVVASASATIVLPTVTPSAGDTATPVPVATNTSAPAPTSTEADAPEPTAIPTSQPTATDTTTPQPTATYSATPRPAATDTPTPLPTRTPTPPRLATATPKPTATTPPAALAKATLPAPVLQGPEEINTTGPATFAWQWSGPALTPDQGFEVRVWKDGQLDHYGAADPVNTTSTTINLAGSYGVQQGGLGEYWWTVAVVQRAPDYRRIGAEAPRRRLIVSGRVEPPSHAPTPRPP